MYEIAELPIANQPQLAFGEFKRGETTEERIRLAEKYLAESADTWIAQYTYFQLDRQIAEEEVAIGEKRKEILETEPSLFLQELERVVRDYTFYHYIPQLDIDEEVEEQILAQEKSHKKQMWIEFLEALDVQESLSSRRVKDVLEWFREKMESGAVDFVKAPKKIESDLDRQRKRLSEGSSSFALYSSEEETMLVINGSLLGSSFSGADFLVSIAHEKAHEDLANYRRVHPSEAGDTEIVLSEFYAMLEEQSTYDELSERDKETISKPQRYEGKVEEGVFEGSLPNSKMKVRYYEGRLNQIMARAYKHALSQRKQHMVLEKAMEGIGAGLSNEEIIEQIKRIKVKGIPVISREDLRLREVKA